MVSPLDLLSGNTEYGAVKFTIQKFYRINGGSTQLKGVTPDIIMPDENEYLKLREKDNDNAMPWDEIEKTNYTTWTPGYDLNALKEKEQQKIKQNVNFSLINNNAQWLAKENDKTYSLNFEKYKQEQKVVKMTVKQNDSLAKIDTAMNLTLMKADSVKYLAADKDLADRYKAWLNMLKSDIYLKEASVVISDMAKPAALAVH